MSFFHSSCRSILTWMRTGCCIWKTVVLAFLIIEEVSSYFELKCVIKWIYVYLEPHTTVKNLKLIAGLFLHLSTIVWGLLKGRASETQLDFYLCLLQDFINFADGSDSQQYSQACKVRYYLHLLFSLIDWKNKFINKINPFSPKRSAPYFSLQFQCIVKQSGYKN